MGKRTLVGIVLLLLAALVAAGALFVVQNASRTTQLSLDLGFAAWQLASPVSVPVLVGSSLGVGFALGLVFAGWWTIRSSSRRRRRYPADTPLDENWR